MAGKKGMKYGPRSRYFVCAYSPKKGEVVHKTIGFLKEDALNASEEEAKARFALEHNGIEPTMIVGPFPGISPVKESRDVVILSADQLRFTGSAWTGVYEGWNVVAQGIRGNGDFESDKLVALNFTTKAVADAGPQPKLSRSAAVPIDMIENLTEA